MNSPDFESTSSLSAGAQRALADLHRRVDQLVWIGSCEDGQMLFANSACAEIFPLAQAELIRDGLAWQRSLPTEDLQPLLARLQQLQVEEEFEIEFDVAGPVRPRRLRVRCFRLDEADQDSAIYGALGTDITALYETRNRLLDSEVLYSSLVENLPLNVIRKDLEGRIVFANQRFSSLIGLSLEDLYGKTDFDLFPQDLAAKYTRDDQHVLTTGDTLHAEEEHQTSQGDKRFVEVFKGPVRDMNNDTIGVQVIFWDVTQRKRTEKKLRHERFLLHTLLDNLPDSIYFKNEHSQFVRVSRSLAKKFGLTDPAEAIGKTDADFFANEHAGLARLDEQEMMASGNPVLGKIEKETWIDGHTSWCSTSKLPLRDDSGRVVGTFGISRDITELIEIEEALSRERTCCEP